MAIDMSADKAVRLRPETHARLVRTAGQLQGTTGRRVTLEGAILEALDALDMAASEAANEYEADQRARD
jgi:predicted YcjX-like family ATPase